MRSNSISLASNEITVTAEASSGSSGGGTITESPIPELTAATKAQNDYLLIIGAVVLLLALFLFFKKKTKIAIPLMVLAIAALVMFFTSK